MKCSNIIIEKNAATIYPPCKEPGEYKTKNEIILLKIGQENN